MLKSNSTLVVLAKAFANPLQNIRKCSGQEYVVKTMKQELEINACLLKCGILFLDATFR